MIGRHFVRIVSVSLLIIIIACGQDLRTGPGSPLEANQVLAANATIRYVNLEGGCWALETAKGSYEPIGLPDSFKVDGLSVYAVLRAAPEAVSICQMAPLVTLDTIRIR